MQINRMKSRAQRTVLRGVGHSTSLCSSSELHIARKGTAIPGAQPAVCTHLDRALQVGLGQLHPFSLFLLDGALLHSICSPMTPCDVETCSAAASHLEVPTHLNTGLLRHQACMLGGGSMPEGSSFRVPLPCDILKAAAVLGHKVSQLLHHFAHVWV